MTGSRSLGVHVTRVHGDRAIVPRGFDQIDPARWSSLLYVFGCYFGTKTELGRSFWTEDD